MRPRTIISLAAVAVASSACYHAVIDTGRPAGTTAIHKPWAHGWIYGLVPPEPIETAAKCPNGVSKVETQLSFLNQLVSGLTLGIYTPMQIDITCASGSASLTPSNTVRVAAGASAEQREQAFERAALLSAERGEAVFVRLE